MSAAPGSLLPALYHSQAGMMLISEEQSSSPEAMPLLPPLPASWAPTARLLEVRLPSRHAVPGRNPTQGLLSLPAAPLHWKLLVQACLGCPEGLQALCLLPPLLPTPPGSLSCGFMTVPLWPLPLLAPGPALWGRGITEKLWVAAALPHIHMCPQGRQCFTALASSQGAESKLPCP